MDVAWGDDRSDPAPTRQETAIHESLQRLAGGRSRDVQAGGHGELVLEASVGRESPGVDELRNGLGDLEVQGDRGGAVERDVGDVRGACCGS